ncbi:MAG: sodium:solute symporter family protein [Fimbriimonadaceae bacterium]
MTPTVVHFAPLDWAVVGAFVAALCTLGFSARLRQTTMLQFLAAGRTLTLPVFVATLVSTWYGGILGVGESAVTYGLGTWLLFGVPYYVFALIYALYFAGRVRTGDQLSLPERLEARWGRGVGLVGAVLVLLLAVPAAQVYMLGVLIQCFTGWSVLPSLLVGAVVVTAFLLKGGLLADARVGILAFALMFVGFIVIDVYAVVHHPIAQVMPALRAGNLLQFNGGVGWIGVFSFFVLGAWTLVDPAFHQRVTSSASPQVGRRGVFVSILFWMLFDVLSLVAGLYAIGLLAKLPADPVALYPAFGDAILPPGLKGLFFVGMAGTITSALAGYTLVSGATVGREIAARIFREEDDGRITSWSRAGLFVGSSVAVVVALQVHSVVDIWYGYSGAIVGALLLPISFAYLGRAASKITPLAVALSMAASFLVAAAWMRQAMRTGNPSMNVSWYRQTFSLGTLIPALAVSGAILGVAALVQRPLAGDG